MARRCRGAGWRGKRRGASPGDDDSSDQEDHVSSSDFDSSGNSSDDEESEHEKCLKRMIVKGKEREKGKAVVEEREEGELDELLASSHVDVNEFDDLEESNAPGGIRKKRIGQKRKAGDPPLLWEVLEEVNEKWIDTREKDDANLDVEEGNVVEATEQPPDVILPLLRYQKEWLAWGLKQEGSEIRGGILADEMGMGKTIQAISLVLAARTASYKGCDSNQSLPSSSLALPKIKGTLVICPVVAIGQWQKEIADFTKPGSTSVLKYHGSDRCKCAEEFSKHDFVITSYSTVEIEYRKNMMDPKVRCEWCGRLFYPKKLIFHVRYFCGPDAVKTEKQSKQVKKEKHPTKVASSKKGYSTVEKDGIEEGDIGKGKGTVKTNKKGRSRKIASNISTTAEGSPSTKKSLLHSVTWERIILDEGHYTKNKSSSTSRAVYALESSYKWALSGTPLQNRVGELYSLIRFLQVTPYSYYFCKDCDCKCFDARSKSGCSSCVHAGSRHFSWWNKHIGRPIQAHGYANEGRRAMILLKSKVLQSLLLRRTKKGRAADLALPPRIVTLRRDTLDAKEEDYYDALYTQSRAQFNTYVAANTLMNNYAHIFDLLTRLRQAVNHPYLIVYSRTESLPDGHKTDTVEDCGICNDPAEDPVVTACQHVFCKPCLQDYSTDSRQVSCPSCSKPLTVDLTATKKTGDQCKTVKGFKRSSILSRINLDDFQTSTKIEALREEIRLMIERDGSAKGIVFSQFTSFLDLIKYSLEKSGLRCVQLVGGMSIGAKEDAIKKFTNDPDCKIFLVSLRAGGVALNLTVASYVFLMDPWWNPAVEQQAQDRIHRLGQYRPMRIIRFIIENTVEERILKLQEKKELVFEGTVGGSQEAFGRLTEADLRFLFYN